LYSTKAANEAAVHNYLNNCFRWMRPCINEYPQSTEM
jgi:hypothetical protein